MGSLVSENPMQDPAHHHPLAAPGLYIPDPDSATVGVIVSLQEATLVLRDANAVPLGQWAVSALLAVRRGDAVEYRPNADSTDSVFIADETLIQALSKEQQRLRRAPVSHRKRLWWRWFGVVCIVAALLWGGVAIDQRVPSYAAKHMPAPQALGLGQRIKAKLSNLVGAACMSPEGMQALGLLSARLQLLDDLSITVWPLGQSHVILLPGNQVLVPQELVETAESADVLAGHILAAYGSDLNNTALENTLSAVGAWHTVRYLVTGHMPDQALRRMANTHLSRPAPYYDARAAYIAFETVDVGLGGFVGSQTVDHSSAFYKDFVALYAEGPKSEGRKVLPDGAWLGLQSICVSGK